MSRFEYLILWREWATQLGSELNEWVAQRINYWIIRRAAGRRNCSYRSQKAIRMDVVMPYIYLVTPNGMVYLIIIYSTPVYGRLPIGTAIMSMDCPDRRIIYQDHENRVAKGALIA